MSRAVAAAILALFLAHGALAAPEGALDPAGAPAGDYVLDHEHGSLVVTLPNIVGFPRTTLRLTKLDGTFRYDPLRWQDTQVTVMADARAMEASNSAVGDIATKLFEPDRYPMILFRSTSLTATEDGRGELVGTLMFHGVTKPLTLEVDFNGADTSASVVRMRFTGRGRISRSAFGVTAGRPLVGDAVDIAFDLDFVRSGG